MGQSGVQTTPRFRSAGTQAGCAPCSSPGAVPDAGRLLGNCSGFFLSCLARCPTWHRSHSHYVTSWIVFRFKNSLKLERFGHGGSAVGKEKPLFPTHWVFWRPCAGKEPRWMSKELYPGCARVKPAGKNNWFFIKLSSLSALTCFNILWELTARSDTDAAERPP